MKTIKWSSVLEKMKIAELILEDTKFIVIKGSGSDSLRVMRAFLPTSFHYGYKTTYSASSFEELTHAIFCKDWLTDLSEGDSAFLTDFEHAVKDNLEQAGVKKALEASKKFRALVAIELL